jgi:hypothetical protein
MRDTYDHRTIQAAHDVLAAVWRYRTNSVQPGLPLGRTERDAPMGTQGWLPWLRAEVDGWRNQPRLIALVLTILANQNNPPGYKAEEQLERLLRERHADVPWISRAVPPSGRSSPGDSPPVSRLPPDAGRSFDGDDDEDGLDMCECRNAGRAPCGQIPCRTLCEQAAREGWGPLE